MQKRSRISIMTVLLFTILLTGCQQRADAAVSTEVSEESAEEQMLSDGSAEVSATEQDTKAESKVESESETQTESETEAELHSEDRNPTAVELGRENTCMLSVFKEGTEEKIPASLAIRQAYSIYIPDEDWDFDSYVLANGMDYEEVWYSTINSEVLFGIHCFAGQTLAEAKQQFVEAQEIYVFEDLMGGDLGDPLYGTSEDGSQVLNFMAAEQDGNTYVVFWKYPMEATEGFGAELDVIVQTFEMMAR